MKNRIISVVLAFSLAVANILPVNAQSDLTPDSLEETDTLNDDNKVDTKQEVNEEDNNQISDKEKELNALLTSAKEALKELASQKDIMALVYLTDSYDLKEKPDSSSNSLEKLTSGDTVFIKDIEINDGKIWYFVSHNDTKGYIEKAYLAYSDEDFIAFEDKYVTEIQNLLDTLYALDDGVLCAKSSNYADIAQFPSSYHSYLNALKKAHPNWTFVKQNTNLNWSSVIANEKGAKSLVPGSYVAAYKDGAYGSGGWYYASEAAIKYVMDPRNYLNEDSIFAFELLTYNSSYQTKTAVSKVLANSFMSGALRDNKSMTYATAFYEIGKSLGVSPLFLACRVYQEQGAAGTSPLISGTYSGYAGYYNYFNIGASGLSNAQVVATGLTYAKNAGWNSVYKSLKGGSQIVASSYILAGQDTLYLQKYNVTSKNTYNHQYMQNIFAPMSEGASEKKAYMNTGSINNTFVFKIPVYNSMPSSASPKPTEKDTSITYNLKFDRNGGDPDTNKYYMYWVYGLKYGTTYKVAKCNYVKSGYDFAGWNTKADGSGTAVADQGSFKNLTKTNGATVTLYAQWVKKGSGNTYTVKYKINGTGTGSMSNQKITYGKTANLKAITFCRTGYIFTGWNTKANGSGKKYGDKASVKNLTSKGKSIILYAQWTPVKYNLKFDRNGGNPDTNKYYMYWVNNLTYDVTYKVAACNYVKDGYDFAGWNTKANGKGIAVSDQGSYKNLTDINGATVTLYAQWKKKGTNNTTTYTVKYKINGTGTGSMSNQKITYGKTANLKAITFCRTGYIFTGWNTKANGSGKKYGDKASVKNLTSKGKSITLYAQWTPVKYNLKFDRNGGNPDTNKYYMYWVNNLTYDVTYKVAACNYVKDGYDFAGWNTKADGKGIAVSDKGSYKNLTDINGATVTLYAQWKKKGTNTTNTKTYTVKYNKNGAKLGSMSNQKITYGKTSSLKAITFCRTGYIFTGWNTKANGSGKKYGDKASVKNLTSKGKSITLYAQWTPVKYNLKFDRNGGNPDTSKYYMYWVNNLTYDVTYKVAACNYVKSGYIFTGWNTKANGKGTAVSDKGSYKNLTDINGATVTLYAQWKKK